MDRVWNGSGFKQTHYYINEVVYRQILTGLLLFLFTAYIIIVNSLIIINQKIKLLYDIFFTQSEKLISIEIYNN